MKTICFLFLGSGNTALLSAIHASPPDSAMITALVSGLIVTAFYSWRWLLLRSEQQRLAEVWVTE
jgi:hypothetical protein